MLSTYCDFDFSSNSLLGPQAFYHPLFNVMPSPSKPPAAPRGGTPKAPAVRRATRTSAAAAAGAAEPQAIGEEDGQQPVPPDDDEDPAADSDESLPVPEVLLDG